ncbi:MAG: prevent-host-death protein [Prevotellaceae bacterium]|jgi:PHD/YefM family antitoxin component YafN of YafNO toxin-antitoxin module|nr:prevent-host-death protein [Prevotellaceae bacterium]
MLVVSSREFRENQAMYFDLVDQNNQVIVQRGKNKGYIICPASEIDRVSLNPVLIEKIKRAKQQIVEKKTKKVKTKDELVQLLDNL